MKRKDITALQTMTSGELQKKLAELTMAFTKAKMEKKIGRLANVRLVSNLGDDVARVKTVLTAKMMEN